MEKKRREDGGTFYCPNGHSLTFGNSENSQLRRERDSLKQETARLASVADAAERRARAAEAKSKRQLRRAGAGLCPCCNRSFANVTRHMKTKHPNVVPLAQKGTP